MSDKLNSLDANQVIKRAGLSLDGSVGDGGLAVVSVGGKLVPEKFDDIQLTYVGSTDKIDTVTYLLNSIQICTLTLTYDGNDRITRVQRTTP